MFKKVINGHLKRWTTFALLFSMLLSLFGAGVVIADTEELQDMQEELVIMSDYGSIPPTGIELDEQTLDMFVGESRTLTATILPENADSVNIIWSSEDEKVATVANGVVTAVGAGTTTIRATIEGMEELSAGCAVNVNESVIVERPVTQDTTIKEAK